MDNIPDTKKCSKCLCIKNTNMFGKHSFTKDGLKSECRECRSVYTKLSYSLNKDKILKKQKEWRQHNKAKKTLTDRNYRLKNKSKISKLQSEWTRNKIKNDKVFKLSMAIRNLINKVFKRKKIPKIGHTKDLLKCNFDFLMAHLNNSFLIRYGRLPNESDTLHLDHIVPVYTAKNEEDLKKLNHYTNLQWLIVTDHIEKTKLDMIKKRGV